MLVREMRQLSSCQAAGQCSSTQAALPGRCRWTAGKERPSGFDRRPARRRAGAPRAGRPAARGAHDHPWRSRPHRRRAGRGARVPSRVDLGRRPGAAATRRCRRSTISRTRSASRGAPCRPATRTRMGSGDDQRAPSAAAGLGAPARPQRGLGRAGRADRRRLDRAPGRHRGGRGARHRSAPGAGAHGDPQGARITAAPRRARPACSTRCVLPPSSSAPVATTASATPHRSSSPVTASAAYPCSRPQRAARSSSTPTADRYQSTAGHSPDER